MARHYEYEELRILGQLSSKTQSLQKSYATFFDFQCDWNDLETSSRCSYACNAYQHLSDNTKAYVASQPRHRQKEVLLEVFVNKSRRSHNERNLFLVRSLTNHQVAKLVRSSLRSKHFKSSLSSLEEELRRIPRFEIKAEADSADPEVIGIRRAKARYQKRKKKKLKEERKKNSKEQDIERQKARELKFRPQSSRDPDQVMLEEKDAEVENGVEDEYSDDYVVHEIHYEDDNKVEEIPDAEVKEAEEDFVNDGDFAYEEFVDDSISIGSVEDDMEYYVTCNGKVVAIDIVNCFNFAFTRIYENIPPIDMYITKEMKEVTAEDDFYAYARDIEDESPFHLVNCPYYDFICGEYELYEKDEVQYYIAGDLVMYKERLARRGYRWKGALENTVDEVLYVGGNDFHLEWYDRVIMPRNHDVNAADHDPVQHYENKEQFDAPPTLNELIEEDQWEIELEEDNSYLDLINQIQASFESYFARWSAPLGNIGVATLNFFYQCWRASSFTDVMSAAIAFGTSVFPDFVSFCVTRVSDLCCVIYAEVRKFFEPQASGFDTMQEYLHMITSSRFCQAFRELILIVVSGRWFSRNCASQITRVLGKPARMDFADLLSNIINALAVMFDCSAAIWAGEPIHGVLFGDDPVESFLRSAKDVLRYSNRLYSGLPKEGCISFTEYARNLKELIELGPKVLEESTIHTHMMAKVEEMQATLQIELNNVRTRLNAGSRIAPIAVVIHGDPGIGKSNLVKLFSRWFSVVMQRTHEQGLTFSRVKTTQFWEGYDPVSTPYIHYSELGNESIAALQMSGGVNLIGELNSLIDSLSMPLDMAFDGKGTMFAIPEFVIIDTNNPTMHIERMMSCPSAMFRRFLFVETNVKAEFRQPNSTAIDSSINIEGVHPMDKYNFRVYGYKPDAKRAIQTPYFRTSSIKNMGRWFIEHTKNEIEKRELFTGVEMLEGVSTLEELNPHGIDQNVAWEIKEEDEWVPQAGEHVREMPDHNSPLWAYVMYLFWSCIYAGSVLDIQRMFQYFLVFATAVLPWWIVVLLLIFYLSMSYFDTLSIRGMSKYVVNAICLYRIRSNKNKIKKHLNSCTSSFLSLDLRKKFFGYTPMLSRRALLIAPGVAAICLLVRKLMKKRYEPQAKSDPKLSSEELDKLESRMEIGHHRARVKVKGEHKQWNTIDRRIVTAHKGDAGDLLKLSRSHTFTIRTPQNETAKVFFVSGTWAIINEHIALLADRIQITIRGDFTDNLWFETSTFTKGGEDWGLVQIKCMNRGSLVNHFVSGELVTMAQGYIGNEFVRAKVKRDVNYTSYHHDEVFSYTPNRAGMCGTPLLLQVTKTGAGFVGVHCCGDPKVGIGCSLIINREDLLACLSKVSHEAFNPSPLGMSPQLGLPKSKSAFCHQEFTEIDYLGTMEGPVVMPAVSRLVPSMISGQLQRAFDVLDFEPTEVYGPPQMRPFYDADGNWKFFVNIGLEKMNNTPPLLNDATMNRVKREIVERAVMMLSERGVNYMAPFSVDEAINGAVFDDFFRGINTSTGCGIGYSGKKHQHMPLYHDIRPELKEEADKNNYVIDEEDAAFLNALNDIPMNERQCIGKKMLEELRKAKRWMTEELHDELLESMHMYMSGYSLAPRHNGCGKDEARLLKKILSGKTRIFYITPLVYLIICRMMLGPLYSTMVEYGDIFCTAVGIDMHTQSDALVNRLKDFSEYIIEGDYSGYDVCNPVGVAYATAEIIYEIMSELGYNDDSLMVLNGVLTDAVYIHIQLLNDVFCVPGVQPSGKYGTAEDNSLRGLVMMMYIYYELGHEEYFFDVVLPVIYGDDLLAAVKPWIRETFNNHTYAFGVKQFFGMDFTSAAKDGTLDKFVTIDTMSFLKRKFVKNEEGVYEGRLSMESVYKSLAWFLPSDSLSEEEQLVACCCSALWEVYFHVDLVRYNAFRGVIEELLEESGIETDSLPSYAYIHRSIYPGAEIRGEEKKEKETYLSRLLEFLPQRETPNSEAPSAFVDRGFVTERQAKNYDEFINDERFDSSDVEPTFEPQSGEMDAGSADNLERVINIVGDSANVECKEMDDAIHDAMGMSDVNYALGTFVERFVEIDKFTISAGTDVDVSYDIWSLLINNPAIREKVSNYAYMRANIEIQVVTNASQYVYGSLMLSYVPYPERIEILRGYRDSWNRDQLNTWLSQNRSVEWNVRENHKVVMKVPFISPKYMHRLFNVQSTANGSLDDFVDCGEVFLRSLSALRSTTANASPVAVRILARFVDVEMCMPTGTVMQADERETGPITKAIRFGARIARSLSTIPSLAPMALASQSFLRGMGDVTAYLGYSRPISLEEGDRVLPVPFVNSSHAIGMNNTQSICFDPKRELSIDPRIGGRDVDEMTHSFLGQKETYLTSFDWAPNDSPDVPLWKCGVTPQLASYRQKLDTGFLVQPSSMALPAAVYEYWHGTIQYRFQVDCSAFHAGQFAVVYEPNVSQESLIFADVEFNKHTMVTVDLRDTQSITICVKWSAPTKWLKLAGADSLVLFHGIEETISAMYEYINGMIAFIPVTNLQTNDTLADQDARIHVFVKGDVQYAQMSGNNMPRDRTTLFAQSGEFKEMDDSSLYVDPVSCTIINDVFVPTNDLYMNYIGEVYGSLRTASKRMVTTHVLNVSAGLSTNNKLRVEQNILPYAAPAVGSSLSREPHVLQYLGYCYLGQRGSMDLRYVINSVDKTQHASSNFSHASVTLMEPEDFVGTSTSWVTDDNFMTNQGTINFALSTNGAIEANLPYYSRNLFEFCCANDHVGTNAPGVMDPVWSRRVRMEADLEGNGETDITISRSAGEDHMMFGFLAAAPYTAAVVA